MGMPAARISDMHVCPMQTPGVPPVPHVGGPIVGPGASTVLIGNIPAALVGDTAICTGPPDTIINGSMTVLICGKPAARLGDMTAHGGAIQIGCPTVLIGG
ncbi:MAG: type VI secretion protein [Chitinophagaceae bacterium]|nr:MAG: type VI secretion protein [Chitinophagaceae bacterium]